MLDLLSFTVFSWKREGAYTRTAVTSQTCSNCIFSVLSLNSFKFFKVNDNNDENALLGWPCWSRGIALLESDLCCFRDNFSFTWNWVKITFLSTGMPAHSFCGLTSNCVTQSKESVFSSLVYLPKITISSNLLNFISSGSPRLHIEPLLCLI